MAYSELIKNFSGIRDYMRQFIAYGFRSREEFSQKSLRSYDNIKRRVESWLNGYMSFWHDASGKAAFLSVSSRHIPYNPLYKAWKAPCFTKNDISLHFMLLDILANGDLLSIHEILERIDASYLPFFQNAWPADESTLRKKLKEYDGLGLVCCEKQGNQLRYHLSQDKANLEEWQDAIAFFSEGSPIGVIGSYLLDKLEYAPGYISFKHRYLLFALDSGVMLDLLGAIQEGRKVGLELFSGDREITIPLKIYISAQGGRQYLAAYNGNKKKICFFRLDNIKNIKLLEKAENYIECQNRLACDKQSIWGVSTGRGATEHLEMVLKIPPQDAHIARRLEREKRCGAVAKIDESTWVFTADVFDAREIVPWLRTFIGRIQSLTCSNKRVERQFWKDLSELKALYGGEGDAV